MEGKLTEADLLSKSRYCVESRHHICNLRRVSALRNTGQLRQGMITYFCEVLFALASYHLL